MRPRRHSPMTVAQLKRSMDGRFRTVDRHFRSVETELRQLRMALARSDERNRRQFKDTHRRFNRQFEETRRHFDIVAESPRDDFRIFADAIAGHSERLDGHDVQISRLNRLAL